MLLHMIEAWVNDDADGRKGIYIFLDMEKAFDPVGRCVKRRLFNMELVYRTKQRETRRVTTVLFTALKYPATRVLYL